MRTCACGDVEDEHGGDPEHPGSSACNVVGCDCVAFDHDPDADEDEEDEA